jgi:AraC family transcriptional regulator
MSGEVDFREREYKRPWITNRIKRGSFFLTTGGAPYDVRWKAVKPEPFQAMYVFVELPVLQRALEKIFGADAEKAQLRDISAFTDDALNAFMERLHDELMREEASQLFVSAIAQAIAIHIARNYAESIDDARAVSPSLPGYKLKRVTD